MEPGDLLARAPESLEVACDADGVTVRIRPDLPRVWVWPLLLGPLFLFQGDVRWLVLLLPFVIAAGWRRCEVRLTAHAILVVHALGPWRSRMTIGWSDVSSARFDGYREAIVVERHDGPAVVLWAGGHPIGHVRWLATLIERGCRAQGVRQAPARQPDRRDVDLLLELARTGS